MVKMSKEIVHELCSGWLVEWNTSTLKMAAFTWSIHLQENSLKRKAVILNYLPNSDATKGGFTNPDPQIYMDHFDIQGLHFIPLSKLFIQF